MLVIVLVCITLCPVSFAIILTRKRELFALLLLSFGCLVTVKVLCLILTVLWVGLQCVIMVFPVQTYLFISMFEPLIFCLVTINTSLCGLLLSVFVYHGEVAT